MITVFVLGICFITIGIIYRKKNRNLPNIEANDNILIKDVKRLLLESQNFYISVIQNMSERMVLLEEAIMEIHDSSEKNQRLLVNVEKILTDKDFADVREEADQKELQKEINEMYNRGVSVEEIARRFKRGKGEIQLILSLHKSKKS